MNVNFITKIDKTYFHLSFRIAVFYLILLFPLCQADAQIGYVTNVHDPCIIACGDYYYIFSTGDGIPIRRSRDLSRWQVIGEVFQDIPAWGKQEVPGVCNIWAPDIFYHDGTYYLYYSLSTFGSNRSRIGLATNVTLNPQDPDYNWIDEGVVIESNLGDTYNAIDPNISMDAQGKIWMSFGSFWSGIKIVELDSSTWKPPLNYRLYSLASRSGDTIEAPYIIFRNGYYYLFVSFDLCCRGIESTYKIMVGRSPKIIGPFVDKERRQMLSGGGYLVLAGDDRWRGTGHCAVLMQEEADWLIYHAYDARNNGTPTLRITRLNWDDDGWPVVDNTAPVRDESTSPPAKHSLHQNYPNPFNSSTKIAFDMSVGSYVRLKVYNSHGRELKTLVDEFTPAGHYEVSFDASPLSPGVYFYAIEMGDYRETKKMVVLE